MERWRQALSLRIFDLVPHRHRCIHSTAGLLTTNGQWTANRMRCTHHEARIGTATCVIHPPTGRLGNKLKDSEHLRFEVRLSDRKLASDLDRLGFELRLLSQSTRVD